MGNSKSILKAKSAKPKKENKKLANDNGSKDDSRENPFDFGGLPSRDLKKNLGCG